MEEIKISYVPIRKKPVEGIDYYIEPGGRMVFTERYHLQRGYCCNGRCRHCPWKPGGLAHIDSEQIDQDGVSCTHE